MAKQRKPAQENSALGVQVGKGGRSGARAVKATDVAPDVYVNDISENPTVLEPEGYSAITEVPAAEEVAPEVIEVADKAEPVVVVPEETPVPQTDGPKLPASPDAGVKVSGESPIKAILAARKGATSTRMTNVKDILSARSSSNTSAVLPPSAVLNARRPGGGGNDPLSVLLNRKMHRGVVTKVKS